MPAATAAEVLRFVPGVYVEFTGGIGSKATARIQGSETGMWPCIRTAYRSTSWPTP